MAKKRKLTPKSTAATTTAATTTTTPQKKQQKKQLPVAEQPVEEVEVEVEEEDDDDEVEEQVNGEEVEEDDDDDDEDEEDDDDEDDNDDEPILNLMQPLSKDQLISILFKAAESHPDVKSHIKRIANVDPAHRKIFVHGLGWDATAELLQSAFSQYGEIEDCKVVNDRFSGKSKGYGFVVFKTRAGARKALVEPQKKIGNRQASCQLASIGAPGQQGGGSSSVSTGLVSEFTQRKIYITNVGPEVDAGRIKAFFSQFGEIEDGPLGADKATGKFKGFCLFVYKTVESARKALEEPYKSFEGSMLHCQKAIDGPKFGKPQQQQQQYQGHGQGRGQVATGAGTGVGQVVPGQNLVGQVAPGLNPALGQALTALLASQGAGLGLNNLLGTLGSGIGGAAPGGMQGGYGSQGVPGSAVLSGYGSQGGLQSAYPSQLGQGGSASGRSQHGGSMGGMAPYGGH